MYHLLNYSQFSVNEESYLTGSRQPLYHFTYSTANAILNSDILRMGTPARGYKNKDGTSMKSISVTRSTMYDCDGMGRTRFKLDTNLMRLDGIHSLPLDEIGYAAKEKHDKPRKNKIEDIKKKSGSGKAKYTKGAKEESDKKSKGTYGKFRYDIRPPKNGLGIIATGSAVDFNQEYEERIYQDIKPLGKYVINIDYKEKPEYDESIQAYLNKYPHIIVRVFPDSEKIWIRPIDYMWVENGQIVVKNGNTKTIATSKPVF